MKKLVLLGLLISLVLLSMPMEILAVTVANTSQQGSLLMFPEVDTRGDTETIITIGGGQFVWIQCQWVTESAMDLDASRLYLILGGTTWWSASTGMGKDAYGRDLSGPKLSDAVGSLICWAVSDDGSQQISRNELYGSAMVFDFNQGLSYEYRSWNFKANAPRGIPVGTPGMIELTGSSQGYDACPGSLDFEYGLLGAEVDEGSIKFGRTKLALLPCKQDLRAGGRLPTCTRADFSTWNVNGVKLTGRYVCIKDSFENYLDAIDTVHGYGGVDFTYGKYSSDIGRVLIKGTKNAKCDSGRFLVDPSCKGIQQASPFVGLAVTYNEFGGTKGASSRTLTGVGSSTTGFVKWTPGNPQ